MGFKPIANTLQIEQTPVISATVKSTELILEPLWEENEELINREILPSIDRSVDIEELNKSPAKSEITIRSLDELPYSVFGPDRNLLRKSKKEKADLISSPEKIGSIAKTEAKIPPILTDSGTQTESIQVATERNVNSANKMLEPAAFSILEHHHVLACLESTTVNAVL